MPELLPEECDCQDADLDILTGVEACYTCGTKRWLNSEEIRHREKLQAEWEADYNQMLEDEEYEREHFRDEIEAIESSGLYDSEVPF